MVHMNAAIKPWGLVGRQKLREDRSFGEEVSSGDPSTMDNRWPLAVARRKETRPPGTETLLGRLVSGVGGWDGLGGALGTWARGFLSRHDWTALAAIVNLIIVAIGMQCCGVAIPSHNIL